MNSDVHSTETEPLVRDMRVVAWRRSQLLRAGFPLQLADELARDCVLDLHALIELVERGCEPRLAVRILAPIDPHEHRPC